MAFIDETFQVVMRDLEPTSLELRIPAIAGEAQGLRLHVRRWLEDAGASSDEVYGVVTAMSEAFLNGVEHAQNPSRPQIDVTAHLVDHVVTIVVRDYGSWQLVPRSPRGYGSLLMAHFMHSVEIDSAGGQGTTVTMQRALAGERRLT